MGFNPITMCDLAASYLHSRHPTLSVNQLAAYVVKTKCHVLYVMVTRIHCCSVMVCNVMQCAMQFCIIAIPVPLLLVTSLDISSCIGSTVDCHPLVRTSCLLRISHCPSDSMHCIRRNLLTVQVSMNLA